MSVVVALIAGIILGNFFKWYCLIPTCGLAGIIVLTNTTYPEYSLLGLLAKIIMVIAPLQLGYVVGLVVRDFLGGKRLGRSDDRNLNAPSSEGTDSSEFGEKAA